MSQLYCQSESIDTYCVGIDNDESICSICRRIFCEFCAERSTEDRYKFIWETDSEDNTSIITYTDDDEHIHIKKNFIIMNDYLDPEIDALISRKNYFSEGFQCFRCVKNELIESWLIHVQKMKDLYERIRFLLN